MPLSAEEEDGARLNTGALESSELLDGGGADGRRAATVEELSGLICAPGVVSAPETARRNRGGELSSLLEEGEFDELLEELPDELPDELLVVLSELDGARRSFGRSGSSSMLEELLEELLDELLAVSSELEDARRSLGRLGSLLDEAFEEPLEELPGEPCVMGCDVSSVACEAAECSSIVPSFTSDMVVARSVLLLSCLMERLT